jgi:hypothetical protein
MSLNALHSCPYPIKYPPHGGLHRSEQIVDILVKNGICVAELPQSYPRKTRPIADRIVGVINSIQDRDWDAFRLRRLGGIGQIFHLYESELAKGDRYDAILWETLGESITPKMGKKYGIPVIALPQNLESFFKVYFYQRKPEAIFEYLRWEIYALKLADFVFAISAEEQIVLRNHGVDADYLPYYPSRRLISLYSDIRRKRKKHKKNSFIILGSANNHATREGIIELVDWLHYFRDNSLLEVKLIGNKTESLKETLDYPWLKICGTATQEEIEQYLLETKAVLIHQKKGLGVLTRIPEMLIAGIPVITNRIGARSATHLQGVYVYDSPEELHSMLDKEFDEVPPPPPPTKAEERFIRAVLAVK